MSTNTAYSNIAPPASFADIVEGLIPAVVNISTTQKLTLGNAKSLRPGTPSDLLEEFLERFGELAPGLEEEMGKRQTLGSGFIIDPSGYIVTNYHVIAEAEEITVKLNDKRSLKAKVIGYDSKTDLALLKVDSSKPLPSVSFGDSNTARVGEWIIAIGNPFGLGGTVTTGIISARARNINAGPFDDFIQTDAAINTGNSGGPMFNIKGEVIGINTAIISPSGGNIGIGFATPASLAKPVIDQLRNNGKIRRGWLGIKIQPVTEEIAESLSLKEPQGMLVAEVTPQGPAEQAGIKAGDIILSFDGNSDMQKLPRFVAETPIGQKATIKILRGGETLSFHVRIGELQEEEIAAVKSPKETRMSETLGLSLESLTHEKRQKYKIPSNVKGVLIVQVHRGSMASKRGLMEGDVIAAVNQTFVNSPSQVTDIIAQAKANQKKTILLLINRKGETQYLALPLN